MKGGWGKASLFHLPVENNSTSRLKYWAVCVEKYFFTFYFTAIKKRDNIYVRRTGK